MGEYADMALEYQGYPEDAHWGYGASGHTGARATRRRAAGPGKCPICGAQTSLRSGKHGDFYGCTDYPRCKGSRDFVPCGTKPKK